MLPSSTTSSVPLPPTFASIPRHTLLTGPSPIQPLPRISASLNPKLAIFSKREDLNSGFAFGGNKIRKLEYLAAEALSLNSTALVSIGGIQSNHTRTVAGVAACLGLKCALVQEHWVPSAKAERTDVGNLQLSRLMGADVRIVDAPFGIQHKESLRSLMSELEQRGEKPYYIPAGASDCPLGGLGFARWAFEVIQQEKEMGLFFDVVVVCCVSGSTLAGMIAGFRLAEKEWGVGKRRVVGVDASAKVEQTREQVFRILKNTATKIGLSESEIEEEDVVLDDRFHGGTYGIPDERTVEAIKFGARTEAFITDPVYEGKSLAALMHMARNGEIEEGSNVLYAHLGGQLALNVYGEFGL